MNWEVVEIGGFCKVKHGYAFKSKFFSEEGEYLLLSPRNFYERGGLKLKDKGEKYYIGEIPSEFILKDGDLIIVMTDLIQNAPLLGGAALIPEGNKFLHNQRLGKVINLSDEKIFKKFFFYALNNEDYRAQIRATATGATVRHTAPERIYNSTISLPPLQTQKKIASILSAYDDLIENNLKRIKLLEEAAQNIYKEWFVNMRFPNHEKTPIDAETGLPEAWLIKTVERLLFKVKRSGKLKKDQYQESGRFPVIDQGDGFIAGWTDNEEIVQDQPLPLIVFGDHTRRLKYIDFPFVCGADGTQLLFPKDPDISPEFLYLSVSNIDLSNYAYARHFKYLKEQEVPIPPRGLVADFTSKIKNLLSMQIKLKEYNRRLKEARDILLPRLMNRTIEV